MKKLSYVLLVLVAVFLGACTEGGGGIDSGISQPVAPPLNWTDPVPDDSVSVPTIRYLNISFNGVAYTYSPPPITLDAVLNYGEVGSTADSACIVVWPSADSLWCGCRSISQDGPWPIMSGSTSVVSFLVSWVGVSRELSADEAALCDTIRDATYCTAIRADGSAPSGCGSA